MFTPIKSYLCATIWMSIVKKMLMRNLVGVYSGEYWVCIKLSMREYLYLYMR